MTVRYRWFEVASTDRFALVAEYSGRELLGYYIAMKSEVTGKPMVKAVQLTSNTLAGLRELVAAAAELLEAEVDPS